MNETTSPALLKKLESHRFQVTKESGETLKKFRSELKLFMEQHPEVVGTTVYGSHTKGKARTEKDPKGKSDVDSYIFIDEDEIDGIQSETNVGIGSTINSPNWQNVNNGVGQEFKKLFAEAGDYSEEQMKDMKIRLISKNRIDNDINQMHNYLQKMDDFEKGKGERPLFTERPMDNHIGRIFQLQLGRGLDQYRAYILNELKQKGELGDQIWETFIYQETLSNENGWLTNGINDGAVNFGKKRESLVPHTIDEAIKYFHTEEIKSKY